MLDPRRETLNPVWGFNVGANTGAIELTFLGTRGEIKIRSRRTTFSAGGGFEQHANERILKMPRSMGETALDELRDRRGPGWCCG